MQYIAYSGNQPSRCKLRAGLLSGMGQKNGAISSIAPEATLGVEEEVTRIKCLEGIQHAFNITYFSQECKYYCAVQIKPRCTGAGSGLTSDRPVMEH